MNQTAATLTPEKHHNDAVPFVKTWIQKLRHIKQRAAAGQDLSITDDERRRLEILFRVVPEKVREGVYAFGDFETTAEEFQQFSTLLN